MLDITGGDEDTVQAVMAALEERWGDLGHRPGTPGSRRARGASPDLRRRPAPGTGVTLAGGLGKPCVGRACQAPLTSPFRLE
ncbi:hypothetical protein [Streptomyces goshikiensis]|uniref:hypothetical protein n=1 Tax=Streptomyces goshikiensis TaxID=1942 RepID=UPI003647CA87